MSVGTGACLAWAALHLLIGMPMNRLLVPKAPPHAAEVVHADAAPSGVPWTMIVLAGVFGACWCVSTAMAAHLPRLLQAMGTSQTTAVAAASLVGRDEQLGALQNAWARAVNGNGSYVVLAGEPGIGKTQNTPESSVIKWPETRNSLTRP